jgi:hypothetical protein
MLGPDAQRPAVRRQRLDVPHRQALGREDALHRAQRQVREVLVIDRVELRLLHQAQQVRELDRDRARRRQRLAQATDEVVDVGHVGQHVVAEDQVGPGAARRRSGGRSRAEELDDRLDALGLRRLGGAGRRLDADAGECRARRRTAAGSRRSTPPPSPASRGRGRAACSPARRSARHAPATSSRTTRSRHSRSRTARRGAAPRRPGPACTPGRSSP